MKIPGFIVARKAVNNDYPVTEYIHSVLTFSGQPQS
jgi:hypothetical protein